MSAPVGTLKPGSLTPMRSVPAGIPRPEYVGKKAPKKHAGSDVQSQEIIEKMRIAGRIAALALSRCLLLSNLALSRCLLLGRTFLV